MLGHASSLLVFSKRLAGHCRTGVVHAGNRYNSPDFDLVTAMKKLAIALILISIAVLGYFMLSPGEHRLRNRWFATT